MLWATRAAGIAGSLLIIVFLLHFILQELSLALEVSTQVDRLNSEQSQPYQPENDALAAIFNLALDSTDVKSFSTRFKQMGLEVDVVKQPNQDEPIRAAPGPDASPAQTVTGFVDADQLVGKTSLSELIGNPQSRHPALSEELAHAHAHNNTIFVTWTNYHFVDFVQNWIAHLDSIGVSHYVVGAMDVRTADELSSSGVPVFAMFSHAANGSEISIGSVDLGWGSERFHQMGRLKIELLKLFLGFGLDIMLCDSDTVWLQDPTAVMARFPAADMLVSSDHLAPTMDPEDDGLEKPEAAHSAMNIGVMYARATEAGVAFVDSWLDVLTRDNSTWDQNVYNQLVMLGFSIDVTHESDGRLFYGWNGRLVVGVLPVATFASGHTFHVQHAYEVQRLSPYVVHQTFQYGGTKGKRHRLREANLWHDPPEYYTAGGPYIHAELAQLPQAPGVQSTGNMTMMSDFHLRNMEYQLLQMRDLFAMAVALNRTVILPKITCYCDRYWGPLDACRVPGASQTRLPFVCPLDHIFEPFHFDDKPEQFGPAIRFREHSFLDNKETPETIRKDVLEMEIEMEHTEQLDGAVVQVEGRRAAAAIVQDMADVPEQVLRLRYRPRADGMAERFLEEPFANEALQAGFVARITHMPAFWCCRLATNGAGEVKPAGAPYSPMILGEGILVH
eukprot:jgi/Ulvmu1/6953/UM033_0010.1